MKDLSLKFAVAAACCFAVLLLLGLPGGTEFRPILPVALVPLLFLALERSPWRRFFFGLLAGFLHFALLLYWIVIVLERYGNLPWFFSYPALALLSLYMALYIGGFVTLAGAVLQRWGMAAALWLLPFVWVGLDWIRSVLFSGFPWMDLGYGLWQAPLFIQTADLLGHYFITFLLVLCGCLCFFLLHKGNRAPWSTPALHAGGVVLLCGAVVLYGYFRPLQLKEEIAATNDRAVIGVVQGNIDQSRKWVAEEQRRTIFKYLGQTDMLLRRENRPQLVVWPETALPFFPMRNPLIGEVRRFAKEKNVTLLVGSPWFEEIGTPQPDVRFFNSAFLVTPTGELTNSYFKSHLVPFGEYVPLRQLLPFLAPLVEAVGDFTAGTVTEPLSSGTIKAGVLICFESIFPDIARKWVNAGANVLVNLTNDAWYGRSSAPSQSMAMTVFRAVETRRSLVRAANTGISGLIDPLGRIRYSSDIFIPWAESSEVDLLETVSFYCRYGYLFAPLCALLAAVVGGVLVFRRPKA
jgi:apolipoprotein N-acyltransferase